MQNPFTTTFSKSPENSYTSTERTDEILENFSYERPSESVYKITGVRGAGKTVILAKVEEVLRNEEHSVKDWLVFDLNSSRDMLVQIAAMLAKEGFAKKTSKAVSSISANVLGTGSGIGFFPDGKEQFFDIGVKLTRCFSLRRRKERKFLSELTRFPEQKRW